MDTPELEPSELGTKDHWDSVYQSELRNFEDHGDEGEIWFGEESVRKMVRWTLQNVPPRPDLSVLEVGSGNGTLLFALVDAGYPARRLLGIDYSEGAVSLALSIAKARENCEDVHFCCCDILQNHPPSLEDAQLTGSDSWDLVLDKGTLDAIALMPKDSESKSPVSGYPLRVARLLQPGAYFLITSCNFTEEELLKMFTTSATQLQYHSRIQHKTLAFGGKSGSRYSSMAFIKTS